MWRKPSPKRYLVFALKDQSPRVRVHVVVENKLRLQDVGTQFERFRQPAGIGGHHCHRGLAQGKSSDDQR